MPAWSLTIGAVVFAAFAIGGKASDGLGALSVFVILALVFGFGASRNETLGGLGGPGRDERWDAIDLRATAFSGLVLLALVLGSWIVEIARGEDGQPYGQLAAIGGLAYIAAIAFLRWRS